MLGTIVNTTTILAGSIIGSVFKKGLQEKHQTVLFNAMGLAACGLASMPWSRTCPTATFLCFSS